MVGAARGQAELTWGGYPERPWGVGVGANYYGVSLGGGLGVVGRSQVLVARGAPVCQAVCRGLASLVGWGVCACPRGWVTGWLKAVGCEPVSLLMRV